MRWRIVTLAVGLAVVTASADDAKTELGRLEGEWEVVGVEAGGMKAPAGSGGPEKAVVRDGTVTFFAQGKEMPTFRGLKVEADPRKKPKALDLVRGGRERLPCIYELSDGEWKLAMPLVPKDRKPGEHLPRPESFDTKDKPVMVLVAKRGKG